MRTAATLLLLVAAAAAQDLTHKAPPQIGPVAILNATIHPVSGPPIEDGYVLFHEGRILDLGKMPFEPETARIDAKGKHVYPGFISAFTNLGLTEIGAVRASRDFDEVGDLTPEVRAAVAVNPDSTLIPVARTNGVLTFLTFPGGGVLPGRASLMRVDGWTWEEMALRADAGLVVNWPRTRPAYVPWQEGRRAEEDREKRVRERLRRIEEAFGRARGYVDARQAGDGLSVDIRWEAMRPALEGRRPVFFLAQEYDAIVSAVHFAARYGLKAILVGGHDAWLCADLLKEHDVGVIVRSLHRFPKRSDSDYDESYRLPAKLEKMGVRWCLASGQPASNERNLPYAAARAAAYGLDRDVALKSITLHAARILGIADTHGSLEVRKSATLFIADGDPLEVTTNIEMAFVDGRRIDLSNKQAKLYEKYREKYRQLGLIK
ncbi:MAG: amidohydrolase family protein [Planctomycetota bacterium]|jgi:imidazolonepropionase-like amidohydrolase